MWVAIQEISEADTRPSDLVKQVEAGRAERRAVLEQFQHSASSKATSGPGAAHSQDFLYGEDGLPARPRCHFLSRN